MTSIDSKNQKRMPCSEKVETRRGGFGDDCRDPWLCKHLRALKNPMNLKKESQTILALSKEGCELELENFLRKNNKKFGYSQSKRCDPTSLRPRIDTKRNQIGFRSWSWSGVVEALAHCQYIVMRVKSKNDWWRLRYLYNWTTWPTWSKDRGSRLWPELFCGFLKAQKFIKDQRTGPFLRIYQDICFPGRRRMGTSSNLAHPSGSVKHVLPVSYFRHNFLDS